MADIESPIVREDLSRLQPSPEPDAPVNDVPFSDVPSAVWKLFLGAWTVMFALFWLLFGTNGEARFVVAISILFGLMYFGLPMVLLRQTTPAKGSGRWKSEVQTFTGPMPIGAVLVQIILIPVAMIIGLVGFGLFVL